MLLQTGFLLASVNEPNITKERADIFENLHIPQKEIKLLHMMQFSCRVREFLHD